MDKIRNLNILYNLANSQGIMIVVNIEDTTFRPDSPATIVTTMVPSPAYVIEIPTPAIEVNKHMNGVTPLLVGESSPPPVSVKRVRDEEQQFPQTEGSPK